MAICLGSFSVANAQYEPEKGDFAVELGFTPFNTESGEAFKLNEGMLKARYFISDKNALRLKLGFGIDNSTNTVTNTADPIDKTVPYVAGETVTKTKEKNTNFSIMLGYERHLFTEGRFDVYAGIELGYMMNKFSGNQTVEGSYKSFDNKGIVDGTSTQKDNTDYTNRAIAKFDDDGNVLTSSNNFVGNLFAGVDVYVWRNLYLGAECGLGFKTGKSPNTYTSFDKFSATYKANGELVNSTTQIWDGETQTGSITNATATTSNTTPTGTGNSVCDETTNTSFKLYVEPAIRIGWRF